IAIVNGRSSADHPSVLPDERAAGYAVARRLIEAGHRRIGMIGDLPDEVLHNPRRSATIGLRFAGIADAFAEAGITPERVEIADWNP
ncbi:substrate-binding domain-containing protein, partial [Bacillus sp. SIMBA_005]|uniref:substrate-binding domain-containing protein n=1 Tax=Bacillus sp. SIMBA_005 TaxID=3085754 RepID=UPI00397D9D7C